MTMRLILATLAVAATPTLALAACYGDHAQQEVTMSCADGTVYDATAEKCVPTTG